MKILENFKKNSTTRFDDDHREDIWNKINFILEQDNIKSDDIDNINNTFDTLFKIISKQNHINNKIFVLSLLAKTLDISIENKKEGITSLVLEQIDRNEKKLPSNVYFLLITIASCHGRVDILDRYKDKCAKIEKCYSNTILGASVYKNQLQAYAWGLLHLNHYINISSDLKNDLEKIISNSSISSNISKTSTRDVLEDDISYYGSISLSSSRFDKYAFAYSLKPDIDDNFIEIAKKIYSDEEIVDQWVHHLEHYSFAYSNIDEAIKHKPDRWWEIEELEEFCRHLFEKCLECNEKKTRKLSELTKSIFKEEKLDSHFLIERLKMGDYHTSYFIIKENLENINIEELKNIDLEYHLDRWNKILTMHIINNRHSYNEDIYRSFKNNNDLSSFLSKQLILDNIDTTTNIRKNIKRTKLI